MNLAAWILFWRLAGGSLNADAAQLAAAARAHRDPNVIFQAIAAVESGYSGRNDVRGKAGEIGRLQIKVATARDAGCPEPVEQRLQDHGYNIACGARILRQCYDVMRHWADAIRCFNAPSLPDGTVAYLRKVELEIGKQTLARLP